MAHRHIAIAFGLGCLTLGGVADAATCLDRALGHLRALQRPDGSFEGEVVWCPMILAQYVILRAVLDRPMTPAERSGMILHFRRTRRPPAGWGLHPESPPYVFVTAISYVALRLLGVPADFTRDDIIAAFRRAAMKCHPDRGGTEQQFVKLVEARDRLLTSLGTREAAPATPEFAPKGARLRYTSWKPGISRQRLGHTRRLTG